MPIEIRVPRLGWSMETGTFVEWLKGNGDRVAPGDELFVVEGDKAAEEVESFDAGLLVLYAQGPAAGDEVSVGQCIGYLVADGETPPPGLPAMPEIGDDAAPPGAGSLDSGSADPPAREPGPAANRPGAAARGDPAEPGPAAAAAVDPGTYPSDRRSTPRARRAARRLGFDLAAIEGTGAGGRVRERDVLAAAADGPAGTRVPVSPLRRTIAQRMSSAAATVVPVTLTTRADATRLLETVRGAAGSPSDPARPGVNDWLLHLLARMLVAHPRLQGQWCEDAILLPYSVNVGFAVDTEPGLLVPVIHRAETLTPEAIASRRRELSRAALAGRLDRASQRDATFTLTNLGAFGIDTFTPVVVPPQAAILGVGAIRREPVVVEADRIEIRDRLTLSLTFDHRVLDGAPAARGLAALCDAIEQCEAAR